MRKLIIVFFYFFSLKGISQISPAYSGQMSTFASPFILPLADGSYLSVKKGEVPKDKKNKGWNNYKQAISFLKYDNNFKLVSEVK